MSAIIAWLNTALPALLAATGGAGIVWPGLPLINKLLALLSNKTLQSDMAAIGTLLAELKKEAPDAIAWLSAKRESAGDSTDLAAIVSHVDDAVAYVKSVRADLVAKLGLDDTALEKILTAEIGRLFGSVPALKASKSK